MPDARNQTPETRVPLPYPPPQRWGGQQTPEDRHPSPVTHHPVCIILVLLLVILQTQYIASLHAQASSNIPSAFMDIGLGARVIGMGGAGTALADDATALLWNPANVHFTDKKFDISFEYADLYALYDYSFAGMIVQLTDGFKAGAGFIYSGDEVMNETTVILSWALTGNYIYEYFIPYLPYLTVGSNVKILFASYGNNPDGDYYDDSGLNHQVSGTAMGCALDLGLYCRITPKNTVAMMWKNYFSYLQWDSKNDALSAEGKYTDDIPQQLSFGYVRSENRFNIATQLEKSLHSDTEDEVAVGVEWHLIPDVLDLRTGYSCELLTGRDKRYSIGAGFNFPIHKSSFSLDVAYQIQTQWEKANTMHLAVRFAF